MARLYVKNKREIGWEDLLSHKEPGGPHAWFRVVADSGEISTDAWHVVWLTPRQALVLAEWLRARAEEMKRRSHA